MRIDLDIICLALSAVFFWSTAVVLVGLLVKTRRYGKQEPRTRFAVLICARNEERCIRLPVESVLKSKYPAAQRELIVLADNCTDRTVEIARAAGATVWEKTTPSAGKGEVLAWGIERVRARGDFDAVAVFDADNLVADDWLDAVNSALLSGETCVTGRRQASNSRANVISGWYAVYWSLMNELSNRVRTNLKLSGKLTGTGFAFLLSALPPEGWQTTTMVEDVEFTVQHNLRGMRVAYVPNAVYADEQPETIYAMWRQLRRWTTGGWQVLGRYTWCWIKTVLKGFSPRLFDSYFAIITGVSIAFIHLFNLLDFAIKVAKGASVTGAAGFFISVFGFVFVMGWVTGIGAVLLSDRRNLPTWLAVATFPIFSLVLSAAVLYTLVFPTRKWKPIAHRGERKLNCRMQECGRRKYGTASIQTGLQSTGN